MKGYLILLISLLITGCAGQDVSTTEQDIPKAVQAYNSLGMQYLRRGDTPNAKLAFQRSIEIDSDSAQAYNGLAMVFQLEEDTALAESYFTKAIKVEPDSAMMHNNYGAFLFSLGRYPQACKELARATEDPFYNQRSQAFENLGRCYLLIDRLDAAEHAFKRSLTLTPGRPLAMLQLTDVMLRKNNLEEAVNLFDQFSTMVDEKRVQHSAQSLWLGVQISRLKNSSVDAATYGLILKNMYPDSEEYRQYKESTL
ncbi:type IV pilus biogenesis/stability protein PilW [Amphritea sp. 2_MG-2023]|uniref:type IV pilus biogenesis/stability protein PilW n=1 Tax=Amphritea TaxID=515417 RepID=UPI001C07AE07|nr:MULTISPECIES: type IV pilus biogenesis/stability protein PilW [Amphritea]MBU2967234.1 type IV pilus biogenesis/stability protein PilW [Amphritea atlantica]MDO6419268.1 type IV pilus biogenesis/stability protein PilW [Amphritea sp. 2_MG-2023]MDX2421611.1 type IV pilus biogenesis/stability protein PilW [Amphritea sp.]